MLYHIYCILFECKSVIYKYYKRDFPLDTACVTCCLACGKYRKINIDEMDSVIMKVKITFEETTFVWFLHKTKTANNLQQILQEIIDRTNPCVSEKKLAELGLSNSATTGIASAKVKIDGEWVASPLLYSISSIQGLVETPFVVFDINPEKTPSKDKLFFVI